MPLPVPNLDDRHFQDIVDQAKTLIPQYCPDWTDHNVSDPGVALIELFAWMTDLLLYRVNQVPDVVYVKLLELIGVTLEPPEAAEAPVTFYLSAAQPTAVTIPAGTEVATKQTETDAAIVFTTEADLVIQPARLLDAYTARAPEEGRGSEDETPHDLKRLELPNARISVFPASLAPNDAFVLALDTDPGHHVLALTLQCEGAGGAGVDPTNVPLEWQVWGGGDNKGWTTCEVEEDNTLGLNQPGTIVLRLPAASDKELYGRHAYWLRCRLTEEQAGPNRYLVSPHLIGPLDIEAGGGTARARHATAVYDEILGQSDGVPGQTFKLQHTPVLARDPAQEYVLVCPRGASPQRWTEVKDFADSGPDDRHYTLDSLDGTLTLGPSLLQPDGSVYRFGVVPLRGSELRFRRYRYGGGVAGNLPTQALTELRASLPYIRKVNNWAPARGGRDAQSLEDARLRVPAILRRRTRAVTADDYEHLASAVRGVARARCLAPGAQPGQPDEPKPGEVSVVVLPRIEKPDRRIVRGDLALPDALRDEVRNALDDRRLVGTALHIRAPRYIEVSVAATIRLAGPRGARPADEVERQAEEALDRYLNPYIGGPQGQGWPFGRALYHAEIHGVLQQLPPVDAIEDVRISVDDGEGRAELRGGQPLSVPHDAVIYSGQHRVVVREGDVAEASVL